MPEFVHGGDVLSHRKDGRVPVDFSANLNPLGMPVGVRRAVSRSLAGTPAYPDPFCRALRAELARQRGCDPEWLVFGAGAAELICRLAFALHPRCALLPTPTFSAYEAALQAAGCRVVRYPLRREEGFSLTGRVLEALTPEVELVWLCNPNNPTGRLIEPELLERILMRCQQTGALLVVDECFLSLTADPQRHTLLPRLAQHPNLLLLDAFTKCYALAGLRLGYLLCSDAALRERLEAAGQPWPLSTPAQAAGLAALADTGYLPRSRAWLRRERAWLAGALAERGCRGISGEANFLFFRSDRPALRERLEQAGFLIRGCGNYPGLDEYDFRIAVRTHSENRALMAAWDALFPDETV